jgi:hypothetical protein
MTLKKRLGFIFGALAAVVGLASAAYACAALTTLELSPNKARPGATVTVSGGNYVRNQDAANPTHTDVEIRLDTRRGRILAVTQPTADRRISTTFEVPQVKAGWHTVLATQYRNSDGAPVAGTPGRAQLKVRRTSSGAMVPVAWKPYSGSTDVAPATLPVSQSMSHALLLVALLGLGGAGVAAASWKKNDRAAARA